MKKHVPGASDASEMLRFISEGTAATTGEDFFKSLIRYVIQSLGIRYAIITECANEARTRMRTLVYIERNKYLENFEYDLKGTPCEIVMTGQSYYCSNHLDKLFPREEGVKAYYAVPIILRSGEVAGHLAVFDRTSIEVSEEKLNLLKIFASRAGAEIERLRQENIIRTNMEQYKALFHDSPIGLSEDDFSGVKNYLESIKKQYKLSLEKIFQKYPQEITAAYQQLKRLRVNQALALSFGFSSTEKYLNHINRLFQPDDFKDVLITFDSGNLTFEKLLEVKSASGQVRHLQAKRVILPGSEKTWGQTLLSCVDVTDLKKAQQSLQLALQEVKMLKEKLEAENSYLQQEIKHDHNFDEIISTSKAFKKVLLQVQQVADTNATVLIMGESGTGKELVARAIHSISNRSKRPLVKVNCAALPASLIESELFGHEKGAFTGAVSQKIGRFELAHGGTLFLDEIGELPLDLQAKLLRAIQEGEFERLGSTKTLKVDVRVLAATNRDLEASIQTKEFRADLYYRLNVFPIVCPPLRERKEDIPYLVSHFCKKYGARFSRKVKGASKQTLEKLMVYNWPGNVRELENIIERGIIVSQGLELQPGDWLPMTSANKIYSINAKNLPSDFSLQQIERSHIESVLKKTNGKIRGETGAAKILNIKPTTLEARMKKLGILK